MHPVTEHNIDKMEIFVGGCHPCLTDEEFVWFFEQFGQVQDHRLIRDKLTGINKSIVSKKLGKFRGFGFVTFENKEVGLEVISQC